MAALENDLIGFVLIIYDLFNVSFIVYVAPSGTVKEAHTKKAAASPKAMTYISPVAPPSRRGVAPF
jgi:hypothetical protein